MLHTNTHAPGNTNRMHPLSLELHTTLVLTLTMHQYMRFIIKPQNFTFFKHACWCFSQNYVHHKVNKGCTKLRINNTPKNRYYYRKTNISSFIKCALVLHTSTHALGHTQWTHWLTLEMHTTLVMTLTIHRYLRLIIKCQIFI